MLNDPLYEKCDCEINISNPNISRDEIDLIRKSRRNLGKRDLESNMPLRLSSPPKNGCHSYICWGNIHICDNPKRREEYLKQHK